MRERVQANLAGRGMAEDVDDETLADAEAALYDLLGFVRAFRAVGVAQAMATLEYAAVRSAQTERDPTTFLAEALLANVVPQLEGLSTEQLAYVRDWAARRPGRAVTACVETLDRQGATPAARRDLLRVARYLADRCGGAAAKRSAEIADGAAGVLDDEGLRRLARPSGDGEGTETSSWADLVADDLSLEPFGEVADALQALIDDAAI